MTLNGKLKFLETLIPSRVSVSVLIFILSSAIVRFLGLFCIGLSFYIKYGNKIIDDDVIPALNSFEIYGMLFGSYIQILLFSTCIVFLVEFGVGILGIVSGMKKGVKLLAIYSSFCLVSILVYIALIVMWSILAQFVNHDLEWHLTVFTNRYNLTSSNSVLISGYHEKWQKFFSTVGCCGTRGMDYRCGITGSPGCYDIYSSQMGRVIGVYIVILVVCIVCQVSSILAADYTVIKIQKRQSQISEVEKERIKESYLLCVKNYGFLPMFMAFVKNLHKQKPATLKSVILKILSLIAGASLVFTSLATICSNLITSDALSSLFRFISIYRFNFHNALAGFVCCTLAIGCLTIANAIVGLVGTKTQSPKLHTISFFGTIWLILLKLTAAIFWIVILEEVLDKVRYAIDDYYDVNGSLFIHYVNELMFYFKCCYLKGQYVEQFCFTDSHESVVSKGLNYFTPSSYGTTGLYGEREYNICADSVKETLEMISGIYFTFLSISIICDIVSAIFISKEFKETNISDQELTSGPDDSHHLVPWLLSFYRKNRQWFGARLIYVLVTIVMMIMELSFIILASIFGISNHVDRRYIDSIGDLYKFLAISGVALAPILMINRIIGLSAVYKRNRRWMIVNTVLSVVLLVLCLVYLIIASVLRHDKYPCTYWTALRLDSCTGELEASTGVAIGMFAFEVVAQVLVVIIQDREYKNVQDQTDKTATSDPALHETSTEKHGMFMSTYLFLFVKRQPFQSNTKLRRSMFAFSIATLFLLLMEITFVVLDCLYGFSWILDRQWITTGLFTEHELTVNMGVLFDFLKITFLVLVPIICGNRVFGIVAILSQRRVLLYVNTGILVFTTTMTMVCVALTGVLLGKCGTVIYYFSITNYCPARRWAIVGTALGMMIIELIVQVINFPLNDRCYKYFHSQSDETIKLLPPNDQKGLFISVYDKSFRRRRPFKTQSKIEYLIGAHFCVACVLLIFEVTFIVLDSVYGLSSVIDRDWIEKGLHDLSVGSMNIEVLYKFLSITSLPMVVILVFNRIAGMIAVSREKISAFVMSSVVTVVTMLCTLVLVILGSMLLYQSGDCRYQHNSDWKSCHYMKGIVGVGLAVMIAEFIMQVFTLIVNDKTFRYLHVKPEEDEDTKFPENNPGMIKTLYLKMFNSSDIMVEYPNLKTPILGLTFLSTFWIIIELIFWILVILVFGKPRYIDNVIMETLYSESVDDINLGHLADGLAYTAIGVVPVIVGLRFLGIMMALKKKTNIVLSLSIVTVIVGFGCATLFGLCSYIMIYVYNCFGSNEDKCKSHIKDSLRIAASLYISFFVIETVIHAFQCYTFGYIFKTVGKFRCKDLHIVKAQGQSKRLKIANVAVKSLETVIAFAMLIAIILWISGIHISQGLRDELSDISFYSTNLSRVALGVAITSLVVITTAVTNNITGIMFVCSGVRRGVVVTTVIGSVCVLINLVLIGMQCVLENKINEPAVSTYLSFTILQTLLQIIWIILSIKDIKNEVNNRVRNGDIIIRDNEAFKKEETTIQDLD